MIEEEKLHMSVALFVVPSQMLFFASSSIKEYLFAFVEVTLPPVGRLPDLIFAYFCNKGYEFISKHFIRFVHASSDSGPGFSLLDLEVVLWNACFA